MKPSGANEELRRRMAGLVRKYRDQCLWFLKPDFTPDTVEAALRTLGYLERYGDLAAWREAKEMRQWLSRNFSSISAA